MGNWVSTVEIKKKTQKKIEEKVRLKASQSFFSLFLTLPYEKGGTPSSSQISRNSFKQKYWFGFPQPGSSDVLVSDILS
jgi:hypothetical protein